MKLFPNRLCPRGHWNQRNRCLHFSEQKTRTFSNLICRQSLLELFPFELLLALQRLQLDQQVLLQVGLLLLQLLLLTLAELDLFFENLSLLRDLVVGLLQTSLAARLGDAERNKNASLG